MIEQGALFMLSSSPFF